MVVADEADRHTVEAADKRRIGGTRMVPRTVLNPPQVVGVIAVPRIDNRRPQRNVGTTVRRATKRVSAGKSELIRTKPD